MPKDISNGIKFETDDKLIEMGVKGAEVTNKVIVNEDSVLYEEISCYY